MEDKFQVLMYFFLSEMPVWDPNSGVLPVKVN